MAYIPDLAYSNMWEKHINGQDVQVPIDWGTVNPLPDALVTKCSEWTSIDPSFVANWHGAGALNLPRAAYHYYHNGNILYTSARQAKAFVGFIQANGIKSNDYFICDNEEKDSKGNPKVSIKETLDWFYNVMVGLGLSDYSHFWLYSTADLLNGLVLSGLNSDQLAILKSIKIWTAGYPNNPPDGDVLNNVPARYIPDQTKFGPVIGWQYEENATVPTIPGGVDLNEIDATFLQTWRMSSAPAVVTPSTPSVVTPPTYTVGFPLKYELIIQSDGTPSVTKQ